MAHSVPAGTTPPLGPPPEPGPGAEDLGTLPVTPEPERSTGHLVRSSVAVASGTALSRVTGLARVAVLASVLGGGALSDAYNLANNTPNIVYELVLGGVLSATLVPLFVDASDHDDHDGPSAILSVAVLGLLALTALAIIASPFIVRLYALRLDDAAAEAQTGLALLLLYLFLPQMVGYGLTAIITAALNARRRFLAAAYAPVLNNIVVVCALIAFGLAASELSIPAVRNRTLLLLLLGAGTTAGVVAMAAALWWPLRNSGWRLHWNPDWRHPAVRQVIRLSGWTVGYVAANQITLFVVLALANRSAGDVTAYTYAFIFFQLPHGLIAVSIMTTFVPELASAASRFDWARYRERFSSGALLLVGLLLPASVGYVLVSRGLLKAILERGAYGLDDVVLTAQTLAWFAVGLVGFSMYLFALRGFYALKDTRTPFLLNLFENGLNIVFAVSLVGRHGVPGLAAALSFAYLIAGVVALVALRHRTGGLGGRRLGAGFARIALAAGVMGVVVYQVLPDESGDQVLRHVVLAIPIGAGVYAATLALLWGPSAVRQVLARLHRA